MEVSTVTVKSSEWKAAMQEVLAALPDDVVLVRNRVGNLTVLNAGETKQLGHIDVLHPEFDLWETDTDSK